MHFLKPLKQACFAAGFFCLAVPAIAQNSYLKLGATYNVGLSSSVPAFATDGTVQKDNTATVSVTQQKVNLAEGFVFQVSGGHFFTENLGAEFTFGYLPGKQKKIESRLYYAAIGVTEGYDHSFDPKLLLFQPAVVLRMSPKTITPYGRFGFTLAKITLHEKKENAFWTSSREIEYEYTGGLGFGFQTALGVDFIANDKVTFFAEASLNNLSWSPKKMKMITYRENGESRLDDIPAGLRERNYSSEFTQTFDKNGDLVLTTGASDDIKDVLPINTVGFGLGMKLTF